MFFNKKQKFLGIDIGTSSIKVVELEKVGKVINFSNYALYGLDVKEQASTFFQPNTLPFFEDQVAAILREMLSRAKITTLAANLSLPAFAGFFTLIDLPSMPMEEIPAALNFQANQYIPVPLSEVILDWSLIGEKEIGGRKFLKILLVAAPNNVVEKYSKVSGEIGLRVNSLEVESFSLARALIDTPAPQIIVDIGGRGTSVTVVDEKNIVVCHSLDVSSFAVTQALSSRLNITIQRAEQLKREVGIKNLSGSMVTPVILPVVDRFVFGVERAINVYRNQEPGKQFAKIIFTGEGCEMPGLPEYFSSKLGIPVEFGNPFKKITYAQNLEGILKPLSSSLAVAIGLGLSGFEASAK